MVRHNLVRLEEGVGFREAAMVEPLACVVRGVEESWIGRGQSVAVIGAGPIGLMFVAGVLFFERRQGAIDALVVTPLPTWA